MATDGVKIIDGDLASDIYSTFMEMYDAGASLEEIRKAVEIPFDEDDGFDYEIYITVYALALWQIGQLTPDVLQEVDDAIARGAGVKVWTEEINSKEGQKRQRELGKLREKLALPNSKIRKRRIYKPITKFVFNENAVLAFQIPDGNYCATILMQVYQYQGRCHYHFITPTFKSPIKPTLENIKESQVLLRKVPCGTGHYQVCFDTVSIGPKLLRSFADKFELIGELVLRPEYKHIGLISNTQNFEDFHRFWNDFDSHIEIYKGGKLPLNSFL